jgi:two-component system, NarL family, response regulator NreC
MSQCRIVLADDHAIIRAGLREVLEQQPGWVVLGEASTGAEAINLVRQLTPEVLVTDMVMPGMSGLELVRQVASLAPATRIVVFSMHGDDTYVRESLRAGASAYVLKESATAEIIAGVEHARAGRRYVSSTLSDRIFNAYTQIKSPESDDSYRLLSSREREVLMLAVLGYSSTEIAQQLVLSPRTVESHRAKLLRKLSLRSIADLVRYAICRGLISADTLE